MVKSVKTYMMTELAVELNVSKAKLSQYIRGYTRPNGSTADPILTEETDYRREWRQVPDKNGNERLKSIVVFTEEGRRKIKEAMANRQIGRPKKLILNPSLQRDLLLQIKRPAVSYSFTDMWAVDLVQLVLRDLCNRGYIAFNGDTNLDQIDLREQLLDQVNVNVPVAQKVWKRFTLEPLGEQAADLIYDEERWNRVRAEFGNDVSIDELLKRIKDATSTEDKK